MPGYHKSEITKGVIGEVSKIREELEELEDATMQGNKVMALMELSDLVGAIKLHLERRFPTITLHDLEVMADTTITVFRSGHRK